MVAAALLIRMAVVALVFRALPDPTGGFEQFGRETGCGCIPASRYHSTVMWEWALTALLFTMCLCVLLRLHTVERTWLWAAFGLLYGIFMVRGARRL